MKSELDRRLSEWMKRAQEGDRQAYEALLREVSRLVQAFIRARAGRADWIEDVLQETLISIHRDRHTYDPSRSFCSWMFGIAHHRMIDHQRRSRKQLESEQDAHSVSWTQREEGAEPGTSRFEELYSALRSLSARQGDVVRMLKLEGLTVSEIAGRTGMSEASIKVSAHRGYRKLRKLIGGSSGD